MKGQVTHKGVKTYRLRTSALAGSYAFGPNLFFYQACLKVQFLSTLPALIIMNHFDNDYSNMCDLINNCDY